MVIKVVNWINFAIWAIEGIVMLKCKFENLNPKHIKIVYGITWFVLMWNLLARAL